MNTRIITARRRDLNARGRGEESFRLALVGPPETGHLVWADKHPDAIVTSDTWCSVGIRASERRCSTSIEIPVGTIVVEIEKYVGSVSRRPTYNAGIVVERTAEVERAAAAEGDGSIEPPKSNPPIEWAGRVKHVGVRGQAGVYTHVLEIDGVRYNIRSS